MTAPTIEPERGASGRRALLGRAVFAGPGLLYVTLFMTIPLLIIASYVTMNEIELQNFEPDLVYVDARNRITHHSRQIPAQAAA